ncbi:MAG: peptide-methionine (S)-S-oxide reductase MsrA [Candidatus Eisenbacteria bacterium]|nr:peptide-methionine (S)-S-oxide reductase MsrA [Candidatus Latescibacterota bacterium]MBD3303432.1 peptide-methionine (S)-S-oxide reductase MsrA [Candidatus Eisenbacteria bacterium]
MSNEAKRTNREVATLGGGCFWCIEAAFEELAGVESVVSGYSGGDLPNPSYQAVCTGTTGHAEVVQVTFDPEVLSYADLLRIFFTIHDPTTPNRQGADVGTQYRSVIFTHSPAQREAAVQVIRELTEREVWDDPIVTEVTSFDEFYAAEKYHQQYYENNQNQPYCRAVIEPKIIKLRKEFKDRLKKD